ncbi:MAG TPA: elongation factor P [Terriglobia bacterium]|nr:elongation factor P [Terriglobia bacterium]
MVVASQLRPGMVLKIGSDIFKIFEASYHIGQGKMPGSVHARGRHVLSGTLKEFRFRPEERLEDTQLQRQDMEFLYADAESVTFMNPETYEQVSVPQEAIGAATKFLQPEMKVPVEFYEGQPVSIVFPAIVEAKVSVTAQPVHQQQDNTYKEATLENGLRIMVPHFIKPGEIVRVEVATEKYVDRVRADSKRF